MDKRKKRRLESAGWKVGDARKFLDLSQEEATMVDLKLGLAEAVKKERTRRRMTQEERGRADELKLKARGIQIKAGSDALKRGDFTEVADVDIDEFLKQLTDQPKKRAPRLQQH